MPDTLPPFPNLADITPGQVPASWTQEDTGAAVLTAADVTFYIRADGTISTYINPQGPGPYDLYVAIDGGNWTLWSWLNR